MSLRFSQGKLQGEERKTVIQAVQKQAKAAALSAIQPVLRAFLEEEQTAKLGRAKGEPRHISGQPRVIDWQCGHCGCRDANCFTRDGHYRRGLETGWGHLDDLQVPMLECQNCQHDVVSHARDHGEVRAVLAGFGSAGALWQWAVREFAPVEPAVECDLRWQRGIAYDQRTNQSDRTFDRASLS